MSEATIENERDLSQSPYRIQIRVPFTSDFIKKHFKCSRNSRNIEEIWEKCKKGEVDRTSTINLRLGEDSYSNEKYKQALVRQLASEPTSQKEQFPNWVKFLAGEKARISGNSIYVITTSMNFTKMESFVKCILEMLTFPATIFGYSANFQVDMDSIRLENFQNYHQDSYAFDLFERNSDRYSFNILFDYLVSPKEPIPPNRSLQKYAQALNVARSSNFAQIVSDMLENPGKIAYAKKQQKIYLKPRTFDEATEFFCKRYSRSHKLRLDDLLQASNRKYAEIAKKGSICIYKKNENNTRMNLVRMNFLEFLTENNFKYRFQIFHDAISDLNAAIQNFNIDGEFSALQKILDGIVLSNFGTYNIFSISESLFTKFWPRYREQITQLFADLKEIFDSASEIVKPSEEENHTQADVVAIMSNRISSDPLLYSEDEDETISEYVNTLLSGF